MNILIVTTRDYHLFYKKGDDWTKQNCDNVLDFISQHNKVGQGDKYELARLFFKRESRMKRFWQLEVPEPQLKMICNKFADTDVFIMPCIPKYHIEMMSDYEDSFQLDKKSRQDYLGEIVQDVLEKYDSDIIKIHLVVHDRDIFSEETDRGAVTSDIENGSKLHDLIERGIISCDNIYGFRHIDGLSDMYELVKSLLLANKDSYLKDQINTIFVNSKKHEISLEKY